MSVLWRCKLTSLRVLALATAVAGAATSGPASSTFAAVSAANAPGAVVSVNGTPFLWVADDQGVLHLVSDTRALTGHAVDWSNPAQLTPDQLQGASRGDPWLSTALVKIGDAIYLPRSAAGAPAPTLYHVQSPADLALMGVNGQNYGQLVRDKSTWEQQYSLSADSLQRAELPALVPAPATAAPSATAPAPTSTPASTTGSPAANATSGTLTHVPQVGPGGDVNFDVPGGRGWNDAMSVTAVNDLIPQGMLDKEQTIAQWRALDRSGGPFTYLQVKAIDLATHPDVKNAAGLADLKMRFLCRDVSSCEVGNTQDATYGGVPARVVDATTVRKFGDQKLISGISTDAGDKSADELTWKTRDVFLVKGNYGYDVRLAQTDSNLSTDRLADLDQALATLQFHY